MDWQERITFDHMHSFAWACIKLYETLVDLESRGFGTLVIPSRGTFPFTKNLFEIHQKWALKHTEKSKILHGLSTPFKNSEITLPFTADSKLIDSIPSDPISKQIRNFWVKVLKAWLQGDLTAPELLYYQYIQEDIFGVGVSRNASIKKPSTRFVFVDTVVSGRAVTEIDQSMREHGLTDSHYILIVDEGGSSISPRYKRIIDSWVNEGRATIIPVENLFTEDRGPGLTGSWCLVAPQLMEAGTELLPGFAGAQVVGAAAGFIRVQRSAALDNQSMTLTNASLHTLMHSLIDRELFDTESFSTARYFYQKLISDLDAYKHHGFGPLDPEETSRIAKNSILANESIAVMGSPIKADVEDIDVSSSHVIRIYFTDSEVSRLIDGFRRFASHKKQAYWYVHHQTESPRLS
ncbi:hypothetical protein [Pseudomonas sp. BN606]|uniref:hypothetical protein n=1 Tax=Pseudomonas sp. BN606 TaxID=2567894 RepID=UPI0024577273|nr:hypothetical protein [Pseudomonas sp. BN606]MDH4652388.1 hypothetical protein [Pseudomonas sp. BN606]